MKVKKKIYPIFLLIARQHSLENKHQTINYAISHLVELNIHDKKCPRQQYLMQRNNIYSKTMYFLPPKN